MQFIPRQDKLLELAAFDPQGSFDDALGRATVLIGELLEAERVSLMLIDVCQEDTTRLRLTTLYGKLPPEAWEPELRQGIADQVMAGGNSMRVDDISRSEWQGLARRTGAKACFLSCPVRVGGLPAGVLNLSDPVGREAFSEEDQALGEMAAVLVGRIIQVTRLNRLLESRFAQMALTLEGLSDPCSAVQLTTHEPERVARMLAKAFYKEMRHCGFSPRQIIHAAGEIISELTASLNRHKDRISRMN